jgi:hypothetical protein
VVVVVLLVVLVVLLLVVLLLVQVPAVPAEKRVLRHQKQNCRSSAEVCDCHLYGTLFVGQELSCLPGFSCWNLA